MEQVRLMNRVDTKYVTTIPILERLLRKAPADYRIQQIGESRNMPYYTCYFDTSDTQMFYEHYRGKKSRRKVRIRLYEGGTVPPFFEVKSKNNKGQTRKKRVTMDAGRELTPYAEFLGKHTPYKPEDLIRHIENHFYRITLVNKAKTERITIDTDLHFHNFITDDRHALPRIAIIECKRNGLTNDSPIRQIMRELHIHPSGFSKYCIGMALTNNLLRQNRLKNRLKRIERMQTDARYTNLQPL